MTSLETVALFRAAHSTDMESAALDVLRSGQIASGPKVAQFESRFGELVRREHVVTVNDMSSALMLALHLAGVAQADEVLTLAYSCLSSNAPIANLGAKAVWVDMDPETASMSVEDFERAITPKTKAALLYHVAGYPAPTAKIAKICVDRGIALIEDCNNALGATQNGKPIGSFGDYAVFSFYPNRQINAVDGGALCCPDAGTAQRAKRLRRFGINPVDFRDELGEINPASDIEEVGWSAGFSQMNAAMGLAQFPSLADRLARTRANAARLREALTGSSRAVPTSVGPGDNPAFWAFLIAVDQRDQLLTLLKRDGIQASRLHHRNDDYAGFNSARRELPGTDRFVQHVLGLPCGWWLSEVQLERLLYVLRRECGG